jgi:hypothetical protein
MYYWFLKLLNPTTSSFKAAAQETSKFFHAPALRSSSVIASPKHARTKLVSEQDKFYLMILPRQSQSWLTWSPLLIRLSGMFLVASLAILLSSYLVLIPVIGEILSIIYLISIISAFSYILLSATKELLFEISGRMEVWVDVDSIHVRISISNASITRETYRVEDLESIVWSKSRAVTTRYQSISYLPSCLVLKPKYGLSDILLPLDDRTAEVVAKDLSQRLQLPLYGG